MKKLLIAALLLASVPAYASSGYGTASKNIMLDITTMTVDSTAANDYVYVNKVTDTVNGYGSTEKLRLTSMVPNVATLIATNTLTSADCGKTLLLNASTEFATTLPAPAAGCTFNFIVKAAPASASYTILTNASGNVLIGHVETADVNSATDPDISSADDTITVADGVAAVGDSIYMISDGTSWYYTAHTNVYNGIAGTQAD